MKAGNWKNYQEFCDATDWMDPYSKPDPREELWKQFCDKYDETHDVSDYDIIKKYFEHEVDEDYNFMLEMSEEEIAKGVRKFDKTFWYGEYVRDYVIHEHEPGKPSKKFEEWVEENWKTRLEPVLGPNTKQWWVYDNIRNMYIDPPSTVLDSLPDYRDDIDAASNKLLDIIREEPDWLNDDDYWYVEEDFEI